MTNEQMSSQMFSTVCLKAGSNVHVLVRQRWNSWFVIESTDRNIICSCYSNYLIVWVTLHVKFASHFLNLNIFCFSILPVKGALRTFWPLITVPWNNVFMSLDVRARHNRHMHEHTGVRFTLSCSSDVPEKAKITKTAGRHADVNNIWF